MGLFPTLKVSPPRPIADVESLEVLQIWVAYQCNVSFPFLSRAAGLRIPRGAVREERDHGGNVQEALRSDARRGGDAGDESVHPGAIVVEIVPIS